MLEIQLVMKDSTENSWCNEVKRILGIYDLPSAYELFVNPPSNQSAEGAGGLGIIRSNKVGETE